MIRSLSRPNRLSTTARHRGTDQQLIRQNNRLREQILDLKSLNFEYTTLLSKSLEAMYSESSTLTSRQTKLANVNNYQKEFILRLKQQIKGYRDKQAEYARIVSFMKNKPFRSIQDMFRAYESLTGEVGNKKTFIESLEETISSLKKELNDEGEIAVLRSKVQNLEDRNMRTELKCQKLLKEIESGVKVNNSLKIQTYDTEIKLRELELKDQRTQRAEKILSQKLFVNQNKNGRQKSKSKRK